MNEPGVVRVLRGLAFLALTGLRMFLLYSDQRNRPPRPHDTPPVPSPPQRTRALREVLEAELIGGPCDGALVVLVRPCPLVQVALTATDERVTFATYGLQATGNGRFSMRYLSVHSVPA